MSDSWMPRKLEAQFAGRYLISSVLMTSTMKSEPGTPPTRDGSRGVPVSAAATIADGSRAEGPRGGAVGGPASAAGAAGGVSVLAAPAATALARNVRRPTFPPGSFCAIVSSSSGRDHDLAGGQRPPYAP